MATGNGAAYGTADNTRPQRGPRSGSFNRGPSEADVDAACFMMDLRDLHGLLGEIVRPAKRKVFVRDSKYFSDWLHVISDPVVVKVNAGATSLERQASKRSVCEELRRTHRLALTLNNDDMVLCKSQVNVPVHAMVEALRACGHVECRVGFFGMKWVIPKAQPKIDLYVQHHVALHGTAAVVHRNQFDIGIVLSARAVDIFRFGMHQLAPRRIFRDGKVHEMFNIRGFGALQFCVPSERGIGSIKIYQELTHEVISVIPKDNLDDMPKTVRTLRTRVEQLAKLSEAWERYGDDELKQRLLGTRIEITVIGVHTVAEAHSICLGLDLLRLQGIEIMLGGPFEVLSVPVRDVLAMTRSKVRALRDVVRGGNEAKSSIRMRFALTEARQAFGWSGKNMRRHLAEARKWTNAMEADRVQGQPREFHYDGWEGDTAEHRPYIQDFIDNAYWQNHSGAVNPDPHPIMLQKARGSGYHRQKGIYVDRAGAARHFITTRGVYWRQYVKARPGDENEPPA